MQGRNGAAKHSYRSDQIVLSDRQLDWCLCIDQSTPAANIRRYQWRYQGFRYDHDFLFVADNASSLARNYVKALEYILSSQKEDGHWSDAEWSHLDTTCSVTVFLTVYQVTHDEKDNETINKARKRGFDFIINWQRESGLWKDDVFHPAGIETTAHLMQYTLIPAYFMDGIEYAQTICLEAADDMIKEQAENGSWDGENMDHTMDACRNLMLVADTFNQKEKYGPIIEKGVRWLMDGKNDQGWGDFKEELSNVERTADGLDTLLKYRRFCSEEPMSHFWAYSR